MLAYFYNCTEKETRVDAVFVASGLASDAQTTKVYSAGERMIYRNAVINPGQHYSTSTGEYTCPVTGTYFFTYSIYGDNVKDGWRYSRATASLYREGTQISRIYFTNYNSEQIDITLSRSDIVQCSKGGRVWVQSVYGSNHVWGAGIYDMFSGVLLYIS